MRDFFTSRFATIQDFLGTQELPGHNWINIFSKNFWFESDISPVSYFVLFTTVVILLGVIGLIIWRLVIIKKQREVPVYDRLLFGNGWLIASSIILPLLYLFFRSQELQYVSSRSIFLLIILGLIVWLVWLIIVAVKILPREHAQYLEKERFFRYLPKKKASK